MSKLLILFAWFGQILLLTSPIRAHGSLPCQFPFKYKNIAYSSCIAVDDPEGKLWCSTETDNNNTHIQGHYRHCTANDNLIISASCETYPDGRPGDCISILQCPALNSLLQQAQVSGNNGSTSTTDILRNSVCFKDGSNVRICCPHASTNSVTHQQPRPAATTATEPTRRLDNIECGQSAYFQRVVNGNDASLGAWPWMVIFRGRKKISLGVSCSDSHTSCPGWANLGECQRNPAFMNVNCRRSCNLCPSDTGRSNWFCGGSLIKAQYVLTAAHCFVDIEIEFARIGEFDLSKDSDTGHELTAPKPQDIDVVLTVIHPNYRSPCQRCNDIALVKLARPATLDPAFVKPICLPSNPERDMGYSVAAFQKKLGYAAGWGVTDAADILGTHGSDILQQVNLTIQERPFCHQQKRNFPNGQMILCAGQGDGRDVCRADSGGPLMLTDQHAFKWYLVGITSYGSRICGDTTAQGIFTSVHHYMDWINSNIL